MPTREECLREAGIALLNAVIRIEQDRLNSCAPSAPEAPGSVPTTA